MWRWLGFSRRWTTKAWGWAAFTFGVFLATLIATAAGRGTTALGSSISLSAIYVGITYMFPRFVSVSSIGVYAASAVGAVGAAFAGPWELAGVLATQSAAYYGLMWLGWKIYDYKVARAARWEARAQLAEARNIDRQTDEFAAALRPDVPRTYPDGQPYPALESYDEVTQLAKALKGSQHPDAEDLAVYCLKTLAGFASVNDARTHTASAAVEAYSARQLLLQAGLSEQERTLSRALLLILDYHENAEHELIMDIDPEATTKTDVRRPGGAGSPDGTPGSGRRRGRHQ
ncbi:hypothetical protein OG304_24135 [Streptomyces sp. NBC_00160]|uniref:hypothetical protein n=1 Tax=Streptomyces sp. NBC_00160 TaxID=2903628 RepID=UPI00224DAA6F|nr:hypothetical protein [Streptomyces sp. NBC_00160]MCX5306512.1 hypothetical protein [Streptomyces sp. NBC_00160]